MNRLLLLVAVLVVAMAAGASAAGTQSASGAERACLPRWRVVASGTKVPRLWTVVAVSPTDVWAGGYRALAHWDGRKLSVEQVPESRQPTDIEAVTPTTLWAVTRVGVTSWSGHRWKPVPTPARYADAINDVVAFSPKDVWGVGSGYVHWDGRRWRMFKMRREGYLNAVDGTSSRDLWAVGAQGLTGSVNNEDGLVMHWDGRRWKEVEAVNRDDSSDGMEASDHFASVAVLSRSNAWAAHDALISGDLQHWNGKRWTIAQVIPGILSDIAAISSNDIWAVGPDSYSQPRPLIVHWDGRSWDVQKTPFQHLRASLESLAVRSPTDIWAVGNHLIARYSC